MQRTAAALVVLMLGLGACTEQERARRFGGTAEVELKPGEKLVNATWKTDALWFLTRPMEPGEKPTEYVFRESSAWGIAEGAVIIRETVAAPAR